MGSYKLRILELNHTTSIDAGTLPRNRTFCPGVYVPGNIDDPFDDRVMMSGLDVRYDNWRKKVEEEKEKEKEAVLALRDSIISYDVDKRIDSLPKARKNKIRCKIDGVITYVNKVTRSLSDVDCLVLHSTGGIEKAVEEYWDFSVHFVITPNGTIIQNHDEEVIAYGSHNFFKKRSVAVEFVGHFKRRIWRGKDQWGGGIKAHHVPTVQQIYSGRNLVSYLKRKLGIKYVFAHAQAANKNCPGPEIWFNVGEWAIKNGLSADGRGEHKAPGSPISRDWQKEKYDFKNFLSSPEF